MMIRQVPARFKASDGREFDTQAEAERHEAVVIARQEFERARSHYERVLAESQRTADGYPFEISVLRTYYYIGLGLAGLPQLGTVAFFCRNFYVEDGEDVRIVQQEEGRRDRTFRFSELYRTRSAAEQALLETQETWLIDRQAEVQELRTRLQGEEP